MLEHNNPSIDVDDLMARIQQEVAKRGVGYEPVAADGEGSQASPLASIEALLHTAQAKAEVRTKWSGQLRIFPFRSLWVQKMALEALAFAFRDQRHVNLALIAAARENLSVNRGLLLRLAALENEVQRLQNERREMESRK